MTRKKVFYGIYSSVFFRGNHIRLYQIEAVLRRLSENSIFSETMIFNLLISKYVNFAILGQPPGK